MVLFQVAQFKPYPSSISFSDNLFPPDASTVHQTLLSSGIPMRILTTSFHDPVFQNLLSESRRFIASADFGQVLEAAFEFSERLLMEYVGREVFAPAGDVGDG